MTCFDAIPVRFVRGIGSITARPLRYSVKLSFIQAAVPGDLKSAIVVPLFKTNAQVIAWYQSYVSSTKFLKVSGFRTIYSIHTCY